MHDYIELSKAVADAARPCFNDGDRDFVDSDLDAGEFHDAVLYSLIAAVREVYPLPADLIDQLRGWPAEVGDPVERERFQKLLDHAANVADTKHPRRRSA